MRKGVEESGVGKRKDGGILRRRKVCRIREREIFFRSWCWGDFSGGEGRRKEGGRKKDQRGGEARAERNREKRREGVRKDFNESEERRK